jgi:hypothetical protein
MRVNPLPEKEPAVEFEFRGHGFLGSVSPELGMQKHFLPHLP